MEAQCIQTLIVHSLLCAMSYMWAEGKVNSLKTAGIAAAMLSAESQLTPEWL